MKQKVWFITGCSTGFGRELAKYVSSQGHIVVGTLRRDEHIKAFNMIAPDLTIGVKLDVTQSTLIPKTIQYVLNTFGRIDVLVNNAGYGALGAIEEVNEAEMRRQFDVNVFGPVMLIKAVLPSMREKRSGHILNITSIAGLQGYPGVGIYNGSKFALEGVGEALAAEVKHLGIKVINIEPGPFRTDWAGRSANYSISSLEDYRESATKNLESLQEVSGNQVGDPVKGAKAMYEVTLVEDPPMHLPLGGPAYSRIRKKIESLRKEIDQFEYLGLPTDFDET